MKIKVMVADMEADNVGATSSMINALAEVLKTAFPAIEDAHQEDDDEAPKP